VGFARSSSEQHQTKEDIVVSSTPSTTQSVTAVVNPNNGAVENTMPKEKLIFEPVVLSIPVNYRQLTDPIDYQRPRARGFARFFRILSA